MAGDGETAVWRPPPGSEKWMLRMKNETEYKFGPVVFTLVILK